MDAIFLVKQDGGSFGLLAQLCRLARRGIRNASFATGPQDRLAACVESGLDGINLRSPDENAVKQDRFLLTEKPCHPGKAVLEKDGIV